MEPDQSQKASPQSSASLSTADRVDPNGLSGLKPGNETSNPVWNCSLAMESGDSVTTMTVGDIVYLTCNGDYFAELKPPFQFHQLVPHEEEGKAPKKVKYHIHPLEVLAANETDLKLQVTSYRVGSHKDLSLQITTADGKKLMTSPMSWEVSSVIKDPKQQPYGPMGPFEMSQPWWYYTSIGVGVVLVVAWLIRLIKKKMDRRRMVEELARHGTALSPFNQLNKDLRKASRKIGFFKSGQLTSGIGEEVVEAISKEFKMYLVRQLLVPADQWTTRETLQEIKKYHPKIYFERSADIRRVYAELEKAQRAGEQVTTRDCEQLIEMVRVVSEGITELNRRSRR